MCACCLTEARHLSASFLFHVHDDTLPVACGVFKHRTAKERDVITWTSITQIHIASLAMNLFLAILNFQQR